MQADAQTTEPTAAEMDAALVFTVDGYSDADGVDHVTVAAQRAVDAVSDRAESNSARWHAAELRRLHELQDAASSPDLKVKIAHLIDLKAGTFRLGEKHSQAEVRYGSADSRTQTSHEKWSAARKVLGAAATDISVTPVQTAADALIRGEAFANGIDGAGDLRANDGLPEFEEDCNTLALSYRAALRGFAARDELSPAFELHLKARDDAEAAYREASAEYERRQAEVKRRAPVPPELVIKPGADLWWRTEKALIGATQPGRNIYPRLTLEEALAKLPILRAFLPVYDAAISELDPDGAVELIDAALDARASATVALMDCPTTSMRGLVMKFSAFMNEWTCERIGDQSDNPDTIRRMLTESEPYPWGVARLYQDARRILDAEDRLARVAPFDAAGFIERFTAIPGHEITDQGRVQFLDTDAWPGKMSNTDFDALFTVQGERLDTYREGYRNDPAFEPNPEWTPEDEERWQSYSTVILSAEHIHFAYPDDPAKVAELRQIAARQAAIRKSKPVGFHLWEALTDWEKEAVRAEAKRQAREAGK